MARSWSITVELTRSGARHARWLRCQLLNGGLAAPHYLVSQRVADEIIFETAKNNDLP
jgi:hypothetical protein